ncbi:flagellar biosynthesis protein FliO [Frigoribacterium sp. PhB107]|uniref:FliO/MopB family protein n=1 Tax=Frigoribacterium sp. PhB107 TaxID=2485172 RepID=UPI000F475C6F|nr:flagellar biosynthetic protein FliO [Frigoribacterium sp. PhB107]ROP75382.1 flagellar biosynthesis protein FliO [Frigoribacterium sp. PhB107]
MDTLFVALRVALSLGVVLALLWVLQKRLAKGGLRGGRASAPVSIVARQGIGAKASVVVVDVEGERLVLGVTESSITVLAAADAPAAQPAVVALEAAPQSPVVALEPAPQEARVTPIVPLASVAPAPAASATPSFDAVLAADSALAAHPARVAPNGRLDAAAAAFSGNSIAVPAGAAMLRPRGAERRAATRGSRSTGSAAARDPRERARGRAAKPLEGSILAPDTWRQAAAAVRAGRAG